MRTSINCATKYASIEADIKNPGNVKTEMALIALSQFRKKKYDMRKVIGLLNKQNARASLIHHHQHIYLFPS